MAFSFAQADLIPATFTPFNKDLSLNTDLVKDLAFYYQETGTAAVFVGGTTGEFASLSQKEKEQLVTAWADALPATISLWVHVGGNCQVDACRLASLARASGARAISALAPFYFKPASAEDLVSFLQPIAAAAGDLPFYFYHIPGMTGSTFRIDQVIPLLQKHIPTFKGVKYSSGDLVGMQAGIAIARGNLDFLFGSDEALLGALTLGAHGAIGSTYNYASPLYNQVLRAMDAGDLLSARLLQAQAVALVDALIPFQVQRAGKAIMTLMGLPCGPCRPPFAPFSPEEYNHLYDLLKPFDFFSRPLLKP